MKKSSPTFCHQALWLVYTLEIYMDLHTFTFLNPFYYTLVRKQDVVQIYICILICRALLATAVECSYVHPHKYIYYWYRYANQAWWYDNAKISSQKIQCQPHRMVISYIAVAYMKYLHMENQS